MCCSSSSSSTSGEGSAAETARSLLQRCERQRGPSFTALLHFALPRLCRDQGRASPAAGAPYGLHQPPASPFAFEPQAVQQQLAAAANVSPERAAEIRLMLAANLADLLHEELQLNACIRIRQQQQQQGVGGEAAAAAAAAAADFDSPLKKLRLTSTDTPTAAAAAAAAGGGEGLGVSGEDMRLLALFLLPLLVAKPPKETVAAAMRCTFCRCWMGLLKWQQQQQQQQQQQGDGGPVGSLLPLLSLQVPVLLSSVVLAPLDSAFAVAGGETPATRRLQRDRRGGQQTREDARRAAADLLRCFAAAVQQQRQQQQQQQQQASGHLSLLTAFVPVLSGNVAGLKEALQHAAFAAEPQQPLQQQQQQGLPDAVFLQIRDAMQQQQQTETSLQQQETEQLQRLPSPGELAGSLVVIGCALSAAGDSSGCSAADRDTASLAIFAVLQHVRLWAAEYCRGESVKGARLQQQQQQQQQQQMSPFAVYAPTWSDALLLCSLEALSGALKSHFPSLLAALRALPNMQQQQQQEKQQQQQQQQEEEKDDVTAVDSLLSLLIEVSKAGLRRCSAAATGLLLPASSTSLPLHSLSASSSPFPVSCAVAAAAAASCCCCCCCTLLLLLSLMPFLVYRRFAAKWIADVSCVSPVGRFSRISLGSQRMQDAQQQQHQQQQQQHQQQQQQQQHQ